MTAAKTEAPSILVVDDTPANLQMLVGMLKLSGYRPRPVTSGGQALAAARAEPPHLILLDVNMPEMNGFEVCAELKADPLLASIPVIFISAMTDTLDKVRGFQAGGVDYVTKPFQVDEVKARVAAHLEICRQRRELQASYEKLRRSEQMRDEMVHMIVHDLRSPLTAMVANLELLREDGDKLPEASRQDVERSLHVARQMMRLINGVLDVSKMEADKMSLQRSECDLVALIESVLADFKGLVGTRTLSFEHAEASRAVMVDEQALTRIVQNLLANALRVTQSHGEIRVSLAVEGDRILVRVSDDGPGVAPELRERIFDKFAQAEDRRALKTQTTGLGLTFCKLAVEAHGGQIGVDSPPGQGASFWFTLPL
jgi:signal transduction histidine kinase